MMTFTYKLKTFLRHLYVYLISMQFVKPGIKLWFLKVPMLSFVWKILK